MLCIRALFAIGQYINVTFKYTSYLCVQTLAHFQGRFSPEPLCFPLPFSSLGRQQKSNLGREIAQFGREVTHFGREVTHDLAFRLASSVSATRIVNGISNNGSRNESRWVVKLIGSNSRAFCGTPGPPPPLSPSNLLTPYALSPAVSHPASPTTPTRQFVRR